MFAMRAILTPLFFLATLFTWGQEYRLPFAQTSPEVIDSAVRAWEAGLESETGTTVSTSADFSGFRSNRATVTSVQRGIWDEAQTWDCACVPTENDNVIVKHEVSLMSDAGFSSLYVETSGTLLDLNSVTLTFDGNLVAAGTLLLENATLVANAIAGTQLVDGNTTLAQLKAINRTSLTIEGQIDVTGDLEVRASTVHVDPAGALVLSENDEGRATVSRSEAGAVLGLVTRKMTLPATPNRAMSFVEQRITTGLEGVTVNEFLGDIPTWGFPGSDDPSGFSNIGFWSGTAEFNYEAVQSPSDTLPVWEGIYLALAPAESYTVTFSGTLPSEDVRMNVPGDAFTAFFGNASNENMDLQQLDAQLAEDAVGLDCWNTETLQFDHYVSGLCTNGLSATLQPNTTCQFLPSNDVSMTFEGTQGMPNGTYATSNAVIEGRIVFSAENTTGYRDEVVLAIRENTLIDFEDSEDAINTSSLFSACDLYLLGQDDVRSGIAQLDFDVEPAASFDLILGANRPVDGTYSLEVEELNWAEGCAYIVMDGETEARPLEAGHLVSTQLSASLVHNHTIGTVYLVPPVRAEISSPGCEGSGETAIAVLPTGDGPWTVALSNEFGESMEGSVAEDGVTVVFDDLMSGTYTYAVLNEGSMACGAQTGEHTVIRPTRMDIDAQVTHDCGEGGALVAEVADEIGNLTYVWSNGEVGPVASGLEAGTYKVVVTNEFACKDTAEFVVLGAPELSVLATDGACDGSDGSAIELNSDNDVATWNVDVKNANGDLVGFAYGLPTPIFFDILATGTYTVEAQVQGEFGCAPETLEASVVQPVPMTVTATSEAQCSEDALGTASADLIGGLGDVMYTWSDGTVGEEAELPAGSYTVTVTDEAGCSESAEVEVALSPQMSVVPVSPGCEGEGEAGFAFNSTSTATWTVEITDNEGSHVETLTAPGGSAEILGLTSGFYTVTCSHDVEDGCPVKTASAQLIEPSELAIDVTTTPMECGETHAGAIDVTVHGGIGNIDVTWDHGEEGTSLTGLAGGQYYAVVEDDNGCTKEIRVELEETPTVEANFDAPTGGLTDGFTGMTLTFTNTSEGNITGQTWYFGDTDVPSYDYHATHTFEEAGAYDVFLNVWNDKCSHTVRKTVVVSQGETNPHDDALGTMVTSVMEGDLTEIHAPLTTESGWMMDFGAAAAGMTIHVFDLTGRQLCNPVGPDANGQIWVEGDQWPALVLLRLVHEPTNSVRTWKMVR